VQISVGKWNKKERKKEERRKKKACAVTKGVCVSTQTITAFFVMYEHTAAYINQSIYLTTVQQIQSKQCNDGNVAQRRNTRKANAHLAGAQINTQKINMQ